MSTKRIVLLCFVLALAVAAGLAAQDAADQPGPLERGARPITPENPVPRRTHSIAPAYPAEAQAIDAAGLVTLRVTIDQAGHVAEARRAGNPFVAVPPNTPPPVPAAVRTVGDAFVRSAIAAVRQWQYESPADAPIAFNVSFNFLPGAETTSKQDTTTPRGLPPIPFPPPPPPPPPPPAFGSAAAPGPPPVRVGGQIRAPMQLRRVHPVYPAEARAAGLQGVVILEVILGQDGRVQGGRVLRSIPGLDQAAIDAVQQWEYSPTLLNGVPTPVIMTVTVQFSLP